MPIIDPKVASKDFNTIDVVEKAEDYGPSALTAV